MCLSKEMLRAAVSLSLLGGDGGAIWLLPAHSLARWQVSHFNIWPGCVLLKRARKLSAPYLTHCMLNIHLTSLSPVELCKPVIGTARPVVGSRPLATTATKSTFLCHGSAKYAPQLFFDSDAAAA